MPKTITLRVDESVYDILKKAADGERRTLSNFIEVAAIRYLSNSTHVDNAEQESILKDKELMDDLMKGLIDYKKGNYKVVA